MHANRAMLRVREMARLLGVSRSGYYAWRGRGAGRREQADERLKVEIAAAHAASRGTYGAPRIRAELAARGIRTSRKRVARLMRALELRGVSRRRRVRTTPRDAQARPAPDLVDRDFVATALDHLWVADITDADADAAPGGGAGRLQPAGGGLGDGGARAGHPGGGCAGDGDRASER